MRCERGQADTGYLRASVMRMRRQGEGLVVGVGSNVWYKGETYMIDPVLDSGPATFTIEFPDGCVYTSGGFELRTWSAELQGTGTLELKRDAFLEQVQSKCQAPEWECAYCGAIMPRERRQCTACGAWRPFVYDV